MMRQRATNHGTWIAGCLLIAANCLSAGAGDPSAGDVGDLSLTELANTTITSVARRPQRLSQAAAAVFVITRDDIRRSGAVSLPDVLRLAPGVQVARINQNEWAISARGFNNRFASKLLVLVDGRAVYSPLFSGVNWSLQDLPLEDIERIEVIRGPGATMWGANAVNGVINIVTRAAVDTQGTSLSLAAGDTDRVTAAVRHGGKIGDHGYFRVDSRYYDRSVNSELPWGNRWRDFRAGFRADWHTSSRDSFMVTGDVFRAGIHDVFTPPSSALNPHPAPADVDYVPSTGNLVARWERKLTDTSGIALQVSYDRSHRSQVDLVENRDTIDIDFQHHMSVARNHNLVWGLDTRTSADQLTGRLHLAFFPESRRDKLVSGFLQDDISIVPDRLRLVLGAKVEHNSYTSAPEFEPGVQLIWSPNTAHSLWISVARAVRSTARADTDVQIAVDAIQLPNGARITPVLFGNEDFKPETLTAYETGYRFQRARASFDISGFLNRYDQLRSLEMGAAVSTPVVVAQPPFLPVQFGNNVYGEGLGVEISTGYELTESIRLLGTYSFLDLRLHRRPGSFDPNYRMPEGDAPRHQGRLTWYWNLTPAISWDTSLYLVDRLPSQHVGGYASIVSHLGWQLRRGLDAGITVDNLLDRRHLEFISALNLLGRASDTFGRTARANITWSF